jgi:hypothetical protein
MNIKNKKVSTVITLTTIIIENENKRERKKYAKRLKSQTYQIQNFHFHSFSSHFTLRAFIFSLSFEPFIPQSANIVETSNSHKNNILHEIPVANNIKLVKEVNWRERERERERERVT